MTSNNFDSLTVKSRDHFIEKCRHGKVISQCRCTADNKRVIVTDACPSSCIKEQTVRSCE